MAAAKAAITMSDARAEFIAVDRDIDWVRGRIAELEKLGADPGQGVSADVIRSLLAEWRQRLRGLEERREALVRSMCDPEG
jgi:hypothetical protein